MNADKTGTPGVGLVVHTAGGVGAFCRPFARFRVGPSRYEAVLAQPDGGSTPFEAVLARVAGTRYVIYRAEW